MSEIDFANNRLTNSGLNFLLKSVQSNLKISTQLENLNLSFNKLGDKAVDSLCTFIESPKCELLRINLEANFLGDKVISKLCETINKHLYDKLLLLNLGQNNISEQGGRKVATVIENCKMIQVMILYWNKISNGAAAEIIKQMKQHTHLRIFDISWNNIGDSLIEKTGTDDLINSIQMASNKEPAIENSEVKNYFNVTLSGMRSSMSMDFTKLKTGNKLKKTTDFANELSEYFCEKNIYLIHLDISHNNISFEDAKLLSRRIILY